MRFAAATGEGKLVYAQFSGHNFGDIRGAKSALATAHSATGAALQAVQISGLGILMQSGNDFPLGHGFATANHSTVAAVAGNILVLFLVGKVAEVDGRQILAVKISFGRKDIISEIRVISED